MTEGLTIPPADPTFDADQSHIFESDTHVAEVLDSARVVRDTLPGILNSDVESVVFPVTDRDRVIDTRINTDDISIKSLSEDGSTVEFEIKNNDNKYRLSTGAKVFTVLAIAGTLIGAYYTVRYKSSKKQH